MQSAREMIEDIFDPNITPSLNITTALQAVAILAEIERTEVLGEQFKLLNRTLVDIEHNQYAQHRG